MRPELWNRIKDTVGRALELEEVEREAFVRKAAAGDAELEREALALLAPDDDDPTWIDDSPLLHLFPVTGSRFGPYDVGEAIGAGGSGAVFRAQDDLGRTVALKVMRWFDQVKGRSNEQFQREFEALRRVNHEGVVSVLDGGTISGQLYLTMEFVDGPSLRRIVDDAREGTFHDVLDLREPRNAVRAIVELLDALEHVHGLGIVHRDVKPENILLTREGRVRLVDFGIARDVEWATLTRTGHAIGSVHYMSPEQARRVRQAPDPRSDVFSVGSVFYELLTLARAFDGDDPLTVLERILHDDPVSIEQRAPNVPRPLADACRAALAKDRAHRYRSAQVFATTLRAMLDGERVRLPRVPLAHRVQRKVERYPRASAALGSFILAALMFLPFVMDRGAISAAETADAHRRSGIAAVVIPAVEERDGTTIEIRVFDQSPFRWRRLHDPVLAPFPAREYHVEPGLVWGLVGTPRGLAEFVRILAAGDSLVVPRLERSKDAPPDDMVLVPARRHTVHVSGPHEQREFEASVQDFRIDRQPVTNAQFLAFLRSTGRADVLAQTQWNATEMRARRADWDRLPATSMSWPLAEEYAEWCGKRLPTLPEAQVAILDALEAAGVDVASLTDAELSATFAVGCTPAAASSDSYLEHAKPVDDRPDAVHALGNVWLMTATSAPELQNGRFRCDPNRYVAVGYSYATAAQQVREGRERSFCALTREHALGTADHGFRCVRVVDR